MILTEAMRYAEYELSKEVKELEFQWGNGPYDISYFFLPGNGSYGKVWKYLATNQDLQHWTIETFRTFFQFRGERIQPIPVKGVTMANNKPDEDGRKMANACLAVWKSDLEFPIILFWARKYARWDGYGDIEQANTYADAFMEVIIQAQQPGQKLLG